MSQQFRIESESLRDKINSLLPSQARGSIDVDLTGSTTIIPIVDLTETAEGSDLRSDLQRAFSFVSSTHFDVGTTTTDMANVPGYYEIFGGVSTSSGGDSKGIIQINDGATTKSIQEYAIPASSAIVINTIIVKLEAGDTLQCKTSTGFGGIRLTMRQIADVNGNLVNP
jgi:hypothetical protein